MSIDSIKIKVDAPTETEIVDTQQVDAKQTRLFTRKELSKIIRAQRNKWIEQQIDKDNNHLVQMNANTTFNRKYDKQLAELVKRESEMLKKKMINNAKMMLIQNDLPLELITIIDLTNANTVTKSVTCVQNAFQKAVNKTVESRLEKLFKLMQVYNRTLFSLDNNNLNIIGTYNHGEKYEK